MLDKPKVSTDRQCWHAPPCYAIGFREVIVPSGGAKLTSWYLAEREKMMEVKYEKRAVLESQKELLKRLSNTEIELDINKRWKNGIEHHEKSIELAVLIGDLDFVFGDDSFSINFGGDGDNGETLMYILDIYFELLDVETPAPTPQSEQAERK